MLTAEEQSEILALYYGKKQSIRSIAIKLGITRDSVRRVVERRSVLLGRVGYKRGSILDPYKPEILEKMKNDPRITATAVLNWLRENGYLGGISIVCSWMQEQRQVPVKQRQAFLRLEFAPGECAQVDWGEFGEVFKDGVKVHCFAMVLCHSRYMYIEFTRSEKFEDFIRCHENAFRFFGGVPRECWYDNLASAVSERLGGLVRFNSRFMAYMGHHGIKPHACNPARGNEKGRVEDLIKYIRMNFWPVREFKDFEDLTRQSIVWRNQFANQREHRSTRRIPRLHFEASEKQALLSLNPNKYETDEVVSKVVSPDFHILYETNRYSVPWTLVGLTVTVRVNVQAIKIYYHEKMITHHERVYKKHQVITNELHKAGILERKPGVLKVSWQISAVKSLGIKMDEYVELLRSGKRSLRSELAKILALATVYGDKAVYSGCVELIKSGIIGVENLELFLKKSHPAQTNNLKPEPINFQNQRLNRIVPAVDLRRYDALLFESQQNNDSAEKKEEDDDGSNETR